MKSIAVYYKIHEGIDNKVSSKNYNENQEWRSTTTEGLKPFSDVGELHVNIWKVNEGRLKLHPVFYVDLGIKVSFKCEQIRLFVPFVTLKEKWKDLCKDVMEHRDLMCAIFNDDMKGIPQNNTCFCKVESQTNNRAFYLYQLALENMEFEEFNDENKQKGTYITIKIKGNPANEETLDNFKDEQVYLRIRLYVENNDELAITEHVSNDLLQAAFSQTDLFDFRFNEKREIDGKILEKMKSDGFQPLSFDKVHVFYIADTREDVENESSLKIDSRLLEKLHWETYEPENKLRNTHYVAHHWRKRRKNEEPPFAEASVFFSTKYPNIDLWRLASYFSVVILLGWIGSMLSFHFRELSSWQPRVKLALIFCLVVFVVGLIIKVNIGFVQAKIYRKR